MKKKLHLIIYFTFLIGLFISFATTVNARNSSIMSYAIHVNLVDVSGDSPKRVYSYYLFDNNSKIGEQIYNGSYLKKMPGVIGNITNTGNYDYKNTYNFDYTTTKEIGVSNFFVDETETANLTFSMSNTNTELKKKGDTYNKLLNRLLNGSGKSLDELTEDYVMIIEPIYFFTVSGEFATGKASAYLLSSGMRKGTSARNIANDSYSTGTYGSTKFTGGKDNVTISEMYRNANNGNGYLIYKISNETKKSTQTTTSTLNNCDGPIYTNYYLFLAEIDKTVLNGEKKSYVLSDGRIYTHNSADSALYNDDKIFQEILGVNSLSEIQTDGGQLLDIDSSNVSDYYTWYKTATRSANRYYQSGNNFYLAHSQWCKYDQNGNKTACYDSATGCKLDDNGNKTSECLSDATKNLSADRLSNASVVADEVKVTLNRSSTNKNFTFDVKRYFNKGTFTSMASVAGTDATAVGTTYYHPAVYQIKYCKAATTSCDDTVNQAECSSDGDGTHAVFHENNDLATCTIQKDNNSGFTALEYNETNNYCTVSCKEDFDIYLPTTKQTAAGQYFVLDNYTPAINAKRTCVTSEIKYDQFMSDMDETEKQMVYWYNTMKDYEYILQTLKTRQTQVNTISDAVGKKADNDLAISEKEEELTLLNDEYEVLKDIGGNASPIDRLKEIISNMETTIATLKAGYDVANADEDTIAYNVSVANDKLNNYNSILSELNKVENAAKDEEKATKVKEKIAELKKSLSNDITTANNELTELKKQSSSLNTTYNSALSSGKTIATETSRTGRASCGKKPNKTSCTKITYTWTIESFPLIYNHSSEWTAATAFPGDSGTRVQKSCCGGSSGKRLSTALNEWISTYNKKLQQATSNYNTLKSNYKTIQAAYNKCSSTTENSWLTNSYYEYTFEPTVEFTYEDQELSVFGDHKALNNNYYEFDYYSGNRKKYSYEDWQNVDVDSTGFATDTTYWKKGTAVDNEYTNGTDKQANVCDGYKIIECQGNTCTYTASTLNSSNQCRSASGGSRSTIKKFVNNSYIKRTEEVKYTYHLPTVYTIIPSGKTTTDGSLNKTKLTLEDNAVPVNINTLAGTYDYSLKITNIKDTLRSLKATNNTDDNLEERFSASGTGVLNDSSQYTCQYNVVNDIYKPETEDLNFFYRTVDPSNINPNNRILGYNWTDSRAEQVIAKMKEDDADYQVLTKSSDKFSFTLTPATMSAIRTYNDKQASASDGGYSDWDLKCYDYDTNMGYHCYSNFLTCLASGGGTGTNCSNIFGNSLKDYSQVSKDYDYTQLKTNRETLITKQNELDGR